MLLAAGALAAGTANEVLGLGLFDAGYPVIWSEPSQDAGFGPFALQCAIVFAVALSISSLVDRLNG